MKGAATIAIVCLLHNLLLLLASAEVKVPQWDGPPLDPLADHGGVPLAANTSFYNLYRATLDIGTYNMAPMLDYHYGQFLATWKNSPRDEDQPGQRILFSQSLDGLAWSPTDGTNIMFPNMSTSSNPAALFAEPTLHINGRIYAAASPNQFCLYPIGSQVPGLGQESLLLRQVYVPGVGKFGPVFWATSTIPKGFELASKLQGVVTLDQMDATTQADVATLSDSSKLPCGPATNASLKCEACLNGCESDSNKPNMTDELTHYTLPSGEGDVILYRVPSHEKLKVAASVRTGNGSWSAPVLTSIPDDHANLNAGRLPNSAVYLLSNVMPDVFRDPLFLCTSMDGQHFSADHCTALTTCWQAIYQGSGQPFGCYWRHNGGSKQSGCQYPQGLAVNATGPLNGFWAIYSVNKEDIWVLHVPFSDLR